MAQAAAMRRRRWRSRALCVGVLEDVRRVCLGDQGLEDFPFIVGEVGRIRSSGTHEIEAPSRYGTRILLLQTASQTPSKGVISSRWADPRRSGVTTGQLTILRSRERILNRAAAIHSAATPSLGAAESITCL